MCGIFGAIISAEHNISTTNYGTGYTTFVVHPPAVKWIEDMFIVSCLRGEDGAGFFGVTEEPGPVEVALHKKAIPGYDFVQTKAYHAAKASFSDYKYIVGHTRKATQGKVTDWNAHPYTEDHIWLVHNGGVVRSAEIIENPTSYSTDSEMLCAAMAVHDDPITLLEKIEGAYALVWYDKKKDTLSMARNEERPLFVGISKDNSAILFASEDWMISGVGGRHGMEFSQILSLKVGQLMEISVDSSAKNPFRFKFREFKPREKKTTYYGYMDKRYDASSAYSPPKSLPATSKADARSKRNHAVKGMPSSFLGQKVPVISAGSKIKVYPYDIKINPTSVVNTGEVLAYYIHEEDGEIYDVAITGVKEEEFDFWQDRSIQEAKTEPASIDPKQIQYEVECEIYGRRKATKRNDPAVLLAYRPKYVGIC